MKFKKVLALLITGTMMLTIPVVSASFADPLLAKASSGSPSDMIEPLSADQTQDFDDTAAETPSTEPSESPSTEPSVVPSTEPSADPSPESTKSPSTEPSESPSPESTESPSTVPAETPSATPAESPSTVPAETPSAAPTESPSTAPAETPSMAPIAPLSTLPQAPATAPLLSISPLETLPPINISLDRTENEYASNSILSLGDSINVTPVGQGGNVIINGEPTNVTFTLDKPPLSNVTSARSLASSVNGRLLNVVSVGSTVSFDTATVNFYVPGVVSGQDIQVYQYINGQWERINNVEIREDHVIVDMTATGVLAFINGGGEGVITNANAAANTIADRRAEFGSLQSRLENTISNLGVSTENISASESRIRDVDMAQEMTSYTKNNILVQASQAMLAQANQVPQSVLQLLQ